jgi:hypothetical protein
MLVSIATSWHSLACQEEAIDLLRIFEASPPPDDLCNAESND